MMNKNINAPYALRSVHAKKVDTHWNPASSQSAAPSVAAPVPAAAPPASPPAPRTAAARAYTVCAASSPSKGSGYISAVFPVTKTDNAAWTNAFTQFLRQKYSITDVNFLGCESTTFEKAQLSEANRIAGWRNRIDVVETGWTYGPATSAPASRPTTTPISQVPPPKPDAPVARNPNNQASMPPVPSNSSPAAQPAGAAAAVSGPPSTYGVCYANAGQAAYFSAPFKVTDGNYSQWDQAFGGFLQKKYQYAGSVGCSRAGSLADAQSYLKKLMDAFRPTEKVIDTGWTFQ
ncbi:MAG: hypothetical protein ACRD40_07195 [Candidatus Acidiferrales bacterium]